MPAVHVVAGVIRDAGGRILLARRTEGRELAGLWEFPGGKVEPGESADDALRRELREELGIEVVVGDRLIEVPHLARGRRLRLDARHVPRWQGRARGREGQALAWVPPTLLPRYAMPPPDGPVVAALLQTDRILVTPAPIDAESWLAALQRALAGGVMRVHLRPGAAQDGEAWPALAARAVTLCRRHGADVRIHGDLELARATGAGLHLRAAQLAAVERCDDLHPLALSASCHTHEDLDRAQALGCDFALVGSVQSTATHPDGPVLGWAGFETLRERTSLPMYAIGGMHPTDIAAARAHGAQGIAAIRSLWPEA